MKKLTDLNLITRDDINFAIDGKSITRAEFYSKNILELLNLVREGRIFYEIIF